MSSTPVQKIARLTELLLSPNQNNQSLLRIFQEIFQLSHGGRDFESETLDTLNQIAGLLLSTDLKEVLEKLNLQSYNFQFVALNLINIEDIINDLSNGQILKHIRSLPPDALNRLNQELIEPTILPNQPMMNVTASSAPLSPRRSSFIPRADSAEEANKTSALTGHGDGTTSSSSVSSGSARPQTQNSQRRPPDESVMQEAMLCSALRRSNGIGGPLASFETQLDGYMLTPHDMHQPTHHQQQQLLFRPYLYEEQPYPPYQNAATMHGWQGYGPRPGVPSYYSQVSQDPPHADPRSGPGSYSQFETGANSQQQQQQRQLRPQALQETRAPRLAVSPSVPQSTNQEDEKEKGTSTQTDISNCGSASPQTSTRPLFQQQQQNPHLQGYGAGPPGPGAPSYYGQVSQDLVPPYADRGSSPGSYTQSETGWPSSIDMSGSQGYFLTGGYPSAEYSGAAVGRDNYRSEPHYQQNPQHLALQQQHLPGYGGALYGPSAFPSSAPLRHSLTQYPYGSVNGSSPTQQRSGASLIPQSPTWLQAYPWPGHPFAIQTPFLSPVLASQSGGPNSALTAQQQIQFVGNQENGTVGGTEETQQQLYGPNYYRNQQGKNSRSGQKRKEKRLPLQPQQEERKLEVEKHLAGAILGPRGETIEKIRRDSGADIDISEKGIYAPGTKNRIVTIKGTLSAISKAEDLIMNLIDEEVNKQSRS